jgi:tyrosine-protein phosphatase YwqE
MIFFKKKRTTNDISLFSALKADMHSHLIPGIDDGSPDIETSLQLIRGLVSLGYKKLITTPHVMWDMYQNSHEYILDKLSGLRLAVKEAGIDVEIHAAAEYYLDDHITELLIKKEPLLTISNKMVLVEFSMAHPAMGLKEILFEMTMQGYQPVIAHPERYIYMERSRDFYDELKTTNCLFQLNLLSLGHYYGRSANELAHYLIKKGYYELIGTDLHNSRHLEALRDPRLTTDLKKLLDSGKIINDRL